MERRDFLKSASLATVAVLATPSAKAEENKPLEMNHAFLYEHKPKSLPFRLDSKSGLSEKLMTSHWENNYVGSVKALNEVRKRLSEASKDKNLPPYVYNDLKREQLMRTGSVINHELYFENLGGNGKASGKISKLIAASFGSFEAWENEFRRIGNGLGGGPGWVILGYNHHLKTLENFWAYDHMHAAFFTTPLLIMDMYEHSYQLDFGASAGKYIDVFFKNINWEIVEGRIPS